MEAVYDAILGAMDLLLGWVLALPGSAPIIAIGLLTAAIVVLVRLFTTDQDLLEKCRHDNRRLKKRIKQAKKRQRGETVSAAVHAARHSLREHDCDLSEKGHARLERVLHRDLRSQTVQRLQRAHRRVMTKMLKQEGLPLLVAVGLILFVATWSYARLGYHPPEAGEAVRVVARFPVSQIGRIAHLVPEPGLEAEDGWVRTVEADGEGAAALGRAAWTLSGEARDEPYPLVVRFNGRQYRHRLLVGGRTYAEPLAPQGDGVPERALEVRMRPVKLFGVVPGFGEFLPPWLVGYLLVTVAALPLLKRLLGVR